MMFLYEIDLSIFEKALRYLGAIICGFLYKIVAALFELFINISKVELLSSSDISKIYQRVTLMITIIMIFYVTFETVKYVIQPDTMGDKEKGTSKVVLKMIICVVLLAMVPKIFEFSFKLQNTIIENQIIPKLILGPSATSTTNPKNMGRAFAASTFALFYGYTDISGDELLKQCVENPVTEEEFIQSLDPDYPFYWSTVLDWQKENYKNYGNGVAGANLCSLKNTGTFWHITYELDEEDIRTEIKEKDNEEYIKFDGLMAIIVGGFMCYVLALYCIDLGTRVAQLAFLQIIAPIPIIGYLSPKKDNIFSKWVKQCTTTYLDLFLRMILIYFVLFLCNVIQEARANGTLFNNISDDSNKTLIYIAIILGLLLFAQKAPKMLQELFPKMGAASGNFGLKAGERVAPIAARAIGGGLGGAKRLIAGGAAKGIAAYKRNKKLYEETGKTAKDRRKDAKIAREERNKARKNYSQARRNSKKLHTPEERLAAMRDAKNELLNKQSALADARNKRSTSVFGSVLSGAKDGAKDGIREGAKATKLGDVRKQIHAGDAKNKQRLENYQTYLESGGATGIVGTRDRAISSAEQKLGLRTNAVNMETEMKRIESANKSMERANEGEQAIIKAHSSVESNDINKMKDGKLTTKAQGESEIEFKNIEDSDVDVAARALAGVVPSGPLTHDDQLKVDAAKKKLGGKLKINAGDKYGEIYSNVHSNLQTIEARLKQDPTNEGLQKALEIATKQDSQIGKLLHEKLQTQYFAAIANYEATGNDNPRTNSNFDQGSISETYNMLAAIKSASTNPKTAADMEKLIVSDAEIARNAGKVPSGRISQAQYDAFMGRVPITNQPDYDTIEKALKRVSSERQEEITANKNTQQIMANSDALAAAKSTDTISKPDGK